MDNLSFLPGSEPFFFRGGKTGILCIHGFTATPFEVRELGENLAQAGHTVFGPRLTHHATDPSDMNRSTWQDWYFSALDGWHILNAQCERVIVMGVSMGGATALMLAAREKVSAVCTMGSPIYLHPDWRMPFAKYVYPVYPNSPRLHPDWRDEVGQTARVAYPGYPTRATSQLREYLAEVEAVLPKITVPALLMHARIDMTAPPGSMDAIYNRLGSPNKRKAWIDTDKHVVTECVDTKQEVFNYAVAFVEQILTQEG